MAAGIVLAICHQAAHTLAPHIGEMHRRAELVAEFHPNTR
jgi:hypothetical protein